MGRPREDVTPDDLRSAQKWLIGLSDQCGQMARMLEQANMPLAFLHWNGVTGTYGNNLQIAIDQAMIDVETQLHAFQQGIRHRSVEQLKEEQRRSADRKKPRKVKK